MFNYLKTRLSEEIDFQNGNVFSSSGEHNFSNFL